MGQQGYATNFYGSNPASVNRLSLKVASADARHDKSKRLVISCLSLASHEFCSLFCAL